MEGCTILSLLIFSSFLVFSSFLFVKEGGEE